MAEIPQKSHTFPFLRVAEFIIGSQNLLSSNISEVLQFLNIHSKGEEALKSYPDEFSKN